MTNSQMPWENASAFIADVVGGGGSGGKTLDVRQRSDGTWDAVLILDGGYSTEEDAKGSLAMAAENLARAYIAEVEAGRITPAKEIDLAKIGIRLRDSSVALDNR